MGVEDVDVKPSSKYYSNYDWWAGNNLILIDVEGRCLGIRRRQEDQYVINIVSQL